jgi:hypothetical protein
MSLKCKIMQIYKRNVTTFYCPQLGKILVCIIDSIALCEHVSHKAGSRIFKIGKAACLAKGLAFHSQITTLGNKDIEVCSIDQLQANFSLLELEIAPLLIKRLNSQEKEFRGEANKLNKLLDTLY